MFEKEFEADYPGIDIKWVRDSTGIMTAELQAKKKRSPGTYRLGIGGNQPRVSS